MVSQINRSVFLVLSVVLGLSIPLPTLSAPLFDLSPQVDAINKTALSTSTSTPIAPSLDNVTTLQNLEQVLNSLPNDLGEQDQALLLVSLQHAMIRLLLPLMTTVKEYQAYWQEQLHRPYSYFLSKPPHKWFKGKPQKEDLQDTLKVLTIIEHNIAQHIGTLKNNIDEYETVQTHTALQELVEQQQAFLTAFFGDTPQSDFNANAELIVKGFTQYQTSMQELLKPYKPANHFSRNWIAYTTAGLCVGAAACWYLKNPSANKTWIGQVYTEQIDAAKNMKQRIVEQITAIKNTWFSPAPPPINTSILEASDENIARQNLLAIEKHINILKDNKRLPADLEKKYRDLLNDQSIENVRKLSEEELGNLLAFCLKAISEQNAVYKVSSFVHLADALISYALAKGYSISKEVIVPLIQRIDQTTQKVDLIMPFAVLTPIVLLAYIPLSALKFTYNKLAPHKVAHKGILTTLLHVEEILNDNADQHMLETYALGMLTFHLGMLYTYAQDLSLQEHYDFCNDLNKLFNASRTTAQKLKDVEIIRKKYQFLA